ncbi:putative KAP-like P-loop ATPase [Methanococcus voltae]|uniref:P-loop NTPase fold protein n=1 Tax=Methanococcus voltae TaxID=2188 RepID=UPI001AE7E8E8|nr:putative KAP-like P-loop ATPase [Methanococcus voltae]
MSEDIGNDTKESPEEYDYYESDGPKSRVEELNQSRRELLYKIYEGTKNFKNPEKNSYVISLVGEWGCGKTSLFNGLKELHNKDYESFKLKSNNYVPKFISENSLIIYVKNNLINNINSYLIAIILSLVVFGTLYISENMADALAYIIIYAFFYWLIKNSYIILFDKEYGKLKEYITKEKFEKNPLYNFINTGKSVITNIKLHIKNWLKYGFNWLKLCCNLNIEEYSKTNVIMEFNPWYFENEEDLINSFFEEIYHNIIIKYDTLEYDKYELKKKSKKLGKLLKRYGGLIAFASSTTSGNITNSLSLNFSSFSGYGSKNKNIFETKKKIEKNLEDLNVNIIIIIDDLDRLTGKEIKLMFKLIKSVANFPNTVYILGYDKKVVSKALADAQCGLEHLYVNGKSKRIIDTEMGEEYIKKIVQAEFPIPELSKEELTEDFLKKVFKYEEFSKVCSYKDILEDFEILKTIGNQRDFNRLYNNFRFEFNIVRDYVNPFDFLAITILKYRYKKMYDYLSEKLPWRFTPYNLTGEYINGKRVTEQKVYDEITNEINKIIKNEYSEYYAKILSNFIPEFLIISDNDDIEPEELSKFHLEQFHNKHKPIEKYKSINNSEKFNTYFKLNVENLIPNSAFDILFDEKNIKEEKQLIEILNKTGVNTSEKLKTFVKIMGDVLYPNYDGKKIDKSNYEGIIELILNNNFDDRKVNLIYYLAIENFPLVYSMLIKKLQNNTLNEDMINIIKRITNNSEIFKEYPNEANDLIKSFFDHMINNKDIEDYKSCYEIFNSWEVRDSKTMKKYVKEDFDYNMTIGIMLKYLNDKNILFEPDMDTHYNSDIKYDINSPKFQLNCKLEYIQKTFDNIYICKWLRNKDNENNPYYNTLKEHFKNTCKEKTLHDVSNSFETLRKNIKLPSTKEMDDITKATEFVRKNIKLPSTKEMDDITKATEFVRKNIKLPSTKDKIIKLNNNEKHKELLDFISKLYKEHPEIFEIAKKYPNWANNIFKEDKFNKK